MSVKPDARILVIRRDNIGDLVCTTPLLRALRRQLPQARIECLVTSYNRAVLAGHPDIDALHAYTKAKHRGAGDGALGIYWRRLAMMLDLRRRGFDYVLLPGGRQASSQRFARWVAPRQTLLRDEQDEVAGPHEVEQCCHLLPRLGLAYETPAPFVAPRADAAAALRARLFPAGVERVVGLHISARKPSQRWPAERFAAFARTVADGRTGFLLLWAPGREDDPLHPGDDAKAQQLQALTRDLPLQPAPTAQLEELIVALSACDAVVCGDGGAMHLAAGLGKPLVCMFGQSQASRWRPWGVRHELLQPPSQDVRDLPVEDVVAAFARVG